MSLYPVFAEWAKKRGLEAALGQFRGAIAEEVLREYELQFEEDLKRVVIGGPPIIAAAGRKEWYSGPGSHDVFWPALKVHFQVAEHWPEGRIQTLDDSTNMVVAHTPRPDQRSWDAKGLVVGYVQSGKTTNFTSVIAKTADLDYKLVIVLSGIHNGLRRQTQVRLQEQLADLNDDRWYSLTDDARDFHKPTATAAAVLGAQNRVALAVVKKNATVLKRLISWLGQASAEGVRKVSPVLVIDDEADQATVATARINPLIRKLLGLLPRCTYIGYTATPFANVFVDPREDGDLYPRDFILNLPRPQGYFGPENLFGRDVVEGEDEASAPDGYDMIRSVPAESVALLRPSGRSDGTEFTPVITPELRAAVLWFWLATAARRERGDSSHSSMLVHTSVKTVVQEAFKPLLRDLNTEVQHGLATGDATLVTELQSLWQLETTKVQAEDWQRTAEPFDRLLPRLPEVLAETQVIVDNSRSLDRLDYTQGPATVVAVGGNTLSRGLTLEGLVCSFFIRAASSYDTLMQMGRWFGYRVGYEDLPRIWMTDELRDNFRHLSLVEYEMRRDIEHYQQQNATPMQVAVRIRTHPALTVTAKMGAARPASISYAGRRLQTRYFRVGDAAWLSNNLRAANVLAELAQKDGRKMARAAADVFTDVPVAHVIAFLDAYEVHEDSPDMDRRMLRRYIDKQLAAESPTLQTWSVAVIHGDGGRHDLGGLSVPMAVRSRLQSSDDARADIKTLMSRRDRAIDLPLDDAALRDLTESQLALQRSDDAHLTDQGLLALYVIDPKSAPSTERGKQSRLPLNAVEPVIGLGLVFPGEADARSTVMADYLAVDLSDVETDDLEALEVDFEDVDEAPPPPTAVS